VQHCAIRQKRQICVRYKVINCLAVGMAAADIYLDTPHRAFYGGLATARLLATVAQTDAQNAPVDLQLATLKVAGKLR